MPRDVDVVFIPNKPGMQKAFHSWNGMTGTYMRELTTKTTIMARVEAPKPGGTPRNRSKINYSKGALVSSIGSSEHRHLNDLESHVYARVPHAVMVHEGTRRHVIRPKTRRRLVFFWARRGQVVSLRKVNHPGSRRNPFLMRALRRSMRLR